MLDRSLFASGVEEYRPVLMWFWNDRIEEAEIRRQMDEFYSQRLYEFFIHPLSGIEEEYLSERFFDLYETAVRYAAEKGMKCWIYDEYNWPSGSVGGKLITEYPEYRMVVVRHRSCALTYGQQGTIAYPGSFLAAQAVYGSRYFDITNRGTVDAEQGTFTWSNPEVNGCTVYVFSVEKQGGVLASAQMSPYNNHEEGYLDTMNPEAVRKFLDMTHERYAARFGEHFGKTIPGIFTDEVAIANIFDLGADTIPWTKRFEHIFREANGCDLLPKLCELVTEVGDFRQTRYQYWQTITERFSTAYAKQIADWCTEHRLKLTGHCCAEEVMAADLLQSGNTMAFLQHLHIPGIDSILSKQNIDSENFNLAGKMVTSVAEHTGAARTLCETYTGSGWDTTLEEMKRIFNRLAVLGVNLIQFMGAYYSLRDLRKRFPTSYPPTHSFQNPLWSHYGLMSDYISRVCYANSAGVHSADIAVLMPTATVWSEYGHHHNFWTAFGDEDHHPYGELTITERTLHGVHNALLQIQRDFDLLHEPSFLEADIVTGELRFRGHSYKTLIVPSLISLTGDMWDQLRRFMEDGGKAIFVNLLPVNCPDRGSIAAELERASGLPTAELAGKVKAVFAAGAVKATGMNEYGRIAHIATNEWRRKDNAGLRSALQECLDWNPAPLQLSDPCPHLFVLHRRQEGTDLFLLVNDEAAAYSGYVRVAGKGAVTVYDPESGTSYSPDIVHVEGAEAMEIRLPLAGLQALILEVNKNMAVESYGEITETGHIEEELDGKWSFETPGGSNYMRLDAVVRVSDADKDEWYPVHDFSFPAGAGFQLDEKYEMRMTFVVKEIPAELELAIDPAEEDTIMVNGTPVSSSRTDMIWDSSNVLYNLSKLVNVGDNTIVVRSRIPAWSAQHPPLFAVLRGSFGLDAGRALISKPDAVQVPASWSEQGFPDYSGVAIYRRKLQVSAAYASRKAILTVDNSPDAMELWCNGQYVGSSLWNPHRFDVTGRLEAGVNELELRVANTFANMMERTVPSGLLGSVKLIFES